MKNKGTSSNGSTAVADAPDAPEVDNAQVADEIPAPVEEAITIEEADRRAEFRSDVIAAGENHVFEIPLSAIVVDPARNGRTDERKMTDADVKAIAESIKTNGQMMPGELSFDDDDGKLYLTYGFGRIAAIALINSTRSADDQLAFKCFVKLDMTAAQQRTRNFHENDKRKELTVLDRSLVVANMLASGMKQAEIVGETGFSKATVSNYAKISGPLFTDKVKGYIKDGRISQRGAVELCTLKTAEEIEKAAEELIKSAGPTGKVSVAATKKKTRVQSSATKQLTAKEFVDVLDFVFQKQNVKQLAKSTEEILRIVADVVMGRTNQEKALAKLVAYQ